MAGVRVQQNRGSLLLPQQHNMRIRKEKSPQQHHIMRERKRPFGQTSILSQADREDAVEQHDKAEPYP